MTLGPVSTLLRNRKFHAFIGNRTSILQVISFALLNYNGSLDIVRTGRMHTELQ